MSEPQPTETLTPSEQIEQPLPEPVTSLIAQEIKKPDSLVVAEYLDADTLDPVHANNTVSREVLFNVYENLIAYEGSRTDRFVPLLASEVPSLENGLIRVESDGTTFFTFPIRSAVAFHDGRPLTPDDVAYSFRRLLIHSHPDSPAHILLEELLNVWDINELAQRVGDDWACRMVKEAIMVKDGHVIFKLPQPSATFLARLAHGNSWGAVQNREFAMAHGGWDEECATWRNFYRTDKEKLPLHSKARGTGPFKLDRWTPRGEIVLIRNENYWRERARLAYVVVKIVPDADTRKKMFEQGDADMITAPRSLTPNLTGTPGVRTVRQLPTLHSELALFSFDMTANAYAGSGQLDGSGISPDFFTDPDVRKAFSYSFDWESYIEKVYFGEAKQAYGPIPQSLSAFVNSEGSIYSHDLAKAAEHFQRAWGGQLWEKGFQMTVIYIDESETLKEAAQILKDNIEKLNQKFRMEIRSEPRISAWNNYRSGRIPLLITENQAEFPDPHQFVAPYFHTQAPPYALLSKIANYDTLIAQAAHELKPALRQQLYYQLQQRFYEDAISIFFVDVLGRHWERTWVAGWNYAPIWPGQNFYSLSKQNDADVHPALFTNLPETVIEQW
jgi:peptide/nickel transport system substrate-binding protein